MSANLSFLAANLGNNSVKRTPGILVAIGSKGPRNWVGAEGLGSNRSVCAGPPQSQTRITDLALAPERTGPTSA